MKIRIHRVCTLTLISLLSLFAFTARAAAQTPPCGIEIVRAEGPKIDERFVAAPPEQVKAALLRALPAVAAKVHKDDGLHIEANSDNGLREAATRKNRDAGVRGVSGGVAFGPLIIDIREATQDQVKGSMLHIEYQKPFAGRAFNKGNNAQPLAEETVCLVKLLSTNDPASNPRGLEVKDAGPAHAVALPDATPLRVLLRAPLYSRELDKDSTGQTIQFEVAEDVVVDDAVLIRRGALATGHFTDVEKTKGFGRHAGIEFIFDAVTTVDGQSIPVSGASEKARGGRTNATFESLAVPALAWAMHGADVVIRAGTAYDLEVSGQHTVQGGR